MTRRLPSVAGLFKIYPQYELSTFSIKVNLDLLIDTNIRQNTLKLVTTNSAYTPFNMKTTSPNNLGISKIKLYANHTPSHYVIRQR